MLVLLTKRKLRPDGCQTVKPPGILAMPNIFSPPFFFRKLLRQVQDFLRIPRMFACSQTNIPNPLKFTLQFSPLLFPLAGNSISLSLLSVVPLAPISHSSSALPGWDRELSLQTESNRVNLPGVLQELLPTPWAITSV